MKKYRVNDLRIRRRPNCKKFNKKKEKKMIKNKNNIKLYFRDTQRRMILRLRGCFERAMHFKT